MQEFLKFYSRVKKGSWALEIFHSNIIDWRITIGFRAGHPLCGQNIVDIQNCDMDLVFAKAQVELKEWLLKNDGGY